MPNYGQKECDRKNIMKILQFRSFIVIYRRAYVLNKKTIKPYT